MNSNSYKKTDEVLLEQIDKTLALNPNANQRELAQSCGISLGMANAVMKRFVERGWIMVSNLNTKKVIYALSEEGMKTLAVRGKSYIERTFKVMNEYSDIILDYVRTEKEKGTKKIFLCGSSNIKFLIEYACSQNGIEFSVAKDEDYVSKSDVAFLAGERFLDKEKLTDIEYKDVIDLMENA